VEVAAGFVFDPESLSEDALRSAGIDPADVGRGSDHLPIVADVRLVRP
jgi:hypothetical protein